MSAPIDKHLQEDFLEEYQNKKAEIRNILLLLEKTPDDIESLKSLFRSVHTVKSNLHMVGLGDMSKMIHQLEELLDAVRNEQRQFSQLISDLILLNLEAVEGLFSQAFEGEDIQVELLVYVKALDKLSTGSDDSVVFEAIKFFDPQYEYEIDIENSEIADDKLLFQNLANAMEQRLIGKQGSAQRIAEIVLAMNELAGSPVDAIQLEVAAIMHDVAMAFLPLSLLNKTDRYNEEERQKLHNHPNAAANLLIGLENWHGASEMVIQHHERIDGKGYPNQLAGDQICAGAKMLAIADTFESMSHQRADREHRRSIIRVVAEVNACKGDQFDEYWVDVFNQYIRQKHLKA